MWSMEKERKVGEFVFVSIIKDRGDAKSACLGNAGALWHLLLIY